LQLAIREWSEFIMTHAIELEHAVVILPHRLAMCHGDDSDVELFAALIQECFNVQRELRGALVENGELGAVIEQSSHGNALQYSK